MTSGVRSRRAVIIAHETLLSFAAAVFAARGLAPRRAAVAAEALCYGDAAGMTSHGLVNLTRLYLPLLDSGRADPRAEPRELADSGAALLLDADRALGLWTASEAMREAARRAGVHGVGLVSTRNATHIGCAGHHALLAAAQGMIGLVACNCGAQRIARPPGGTRAMLGTNPLAVAAPAGAQHPFVVDMSTTAVPTGRIRQAARAGEPIPLGWLADDAGDAVDDPAAFDRGEAHLQWLGAGPGGGAFKGFGLGLAVELLAGVLAGSALGPVGAALAGDGRPGGLDDDIGVLALAIAPAALRPDGGAARDAESLFEALLACPSSDSRAPVRYPGWHEGERLRRARRDGVAITPALHRELLGVARDHDVELAAPLAQIGEEDR